MFGNINPKEELEKLRMELLWKEESLKIKRQIILDTLEKNTEELVDIGSAWASFRKVEKQVQDK